MVMGGHCHYINWSSSGLFNCSMPFVFSELTLLWDGGNRADSITGYLAVSFLCFQKIKHCVLLMLCSRLGKGLLMGLSSFWPTLNPISFSYYPLYSKMEWSG